MSQGTPPSGPQFPHGAGQPAQGPYPQQSQHYPQPGMYSQQQGAPYPQPGAYPPQGSFAAPQPPKRQRTGCIIAAIVAAVVFIAMMASCSALLSAGSKSRTSPTSNTPVVSTSSTVPQSATTAPSTASSATRTTATPSASASSADTGPHKIVYKVTTNGKATVTYGPSSGSSQETITADWTKDGEAVRGKFDIIQLWVTGDYTNANADVTCEILVDGKSMVKNEGKGAGAHATCSATIKY